MLPTRLSKKLFAALFACLLTLVGAHSASSLDLKTHPDFVPQPQESSPKEVKITPRTPVKQIRPQLPKAIGPSKANSLTIITLNVAATFTTHEAPEGWRWNIMLQNMSPAAIEANRYELKVVQVLDLPGQTSPAGSTYPIPALSTGQQHGFSSAWPRHPSANQLRMEIWDTRTRNLAMQKILPLEPLTPMASAQVNSTIADNKNIYDKPRLIITGGTYLGRGAWRADVKSTSMNIEANRYDYSYIYHFNPGTNPPGPAFKNVSFAVPYGQTRTILESGNLYGAQESDQAGLKGVEVELREKSTGKQSAFTIPVQLPEVEIPAQSLVVRTRSSNERPVSMEIKNKSSYLLLLDYSLELRLSKKVNYGQSWVYETYHTTGKLQLAAGQTSRDVILVNNLPAVFVNMEQTDHLFRRQCAPLYNLSFDGEVAVDATLTIKMPVNANANYDRVLVVHEQPFIANDGFESCK